MSTQREQTGPPRGAARLPCEECGHRLRADDLWCFGCHAPAITRIAAAEILPRPVDWAGVPVQRRAADRLTPPEIRGRREDLSRLHDPGRRQVSVAVRNGLRASDHPGHPLRSWSPITYLLVGLPFLVLLTVVAAFIAGLSAAAS